MEIGAKQLSEGSVQPITRIVFRWIGPGLFDIHMQRC